MLDAYVNWQLPLLVALATVVSAAAAAGVVFRRRGSGGPARVLRVVAGVLLLGVALMITVVTLGPGQVPGPSPSQLGDRTVNLVPLRGIRSTLANPNSQLALLNLAGNILMFSPVGFLGRALFPRHSGRIITAGVVASGGIECVQFVLGRAADIDDVLLNGSGVVVGVLLCGFMRHVGRAGTAHGSGQPAR